MKVILIALAVLNLNISYASTVYRFGSLVLSVKKVDGVTVSASCSDKNCEAYKMGTKFKGKWPSADLLIGGKNPRAVNCKTLMKGTVIIGVDENKAQQSFCEFKDKSFLLLN